MNEIPMYNKSVLSLLYIKYDKMGNENIMYYHRHLTKMMSSFLKTNELEECVNNILSFYMNVFEGDRAYVFVYNEDYSSQNCLYEVASNPALVEKDNLQNVSVDVTPWWTEQICSDNPIFVSSLEQLPKEAFYEYQILKAQYIRSIMVVPLHVHDRIWGYVGIDLVKNERNWDNRDIRKLDLVANTLSLCLELHEIRRKEQTEYQYLANLLRYLPVGYKRMEMQFDTNGYLNDYVIVDANELFFSIKGWDKAKVLGRKASELYSDFRSHLELYLDVCKNKQSSNEFIQYESSTDKYVQWIVYSPVEGELVGLAIDITEQKKIEGELVKATRKAEESNRLKSAFLANMSHEIRTPLHVIMGFSNLLIEAEDKEDRIQYAEVVRRNSETLNLLINDLLDLSKIEAGVINFVVEEVDVNKLCREVAASLSGKVYSEVKLIVETPDSHCVVFSDPSRLHQVLLNFLSNAVKFTSQGSICIGYDYPQTNIIRFYVKDTGIGISTDDLPSIFERFVKLNKFAEGTGLGLAICKVIVQRLGGQIGVESDLGKGAFFWFSLPLS